MNLVDSSGWLEYFANGSNASFFAPPIEAPQNLIVPTLCLFEVFKKVLLERNIDSAFQAASLMQQGKVVDLDATLSMNAAKLSVDLKLPLADSIILATAKAYKATLWTQDADFENLPDVKFKRK